MTTPFPTPDYIIDRYAPSTGAWTRFAMSDGSILTHRADSPEALALGRALLDLEAPAEEVNARLSEWRRGMRRRSDGRAYH